MNMTDINYGFGGGNFRRYYRSLGDTFSQTKVKAYTMLILSLLSMSFFGYFAIRPTLITIATLKRQIKDASFVDSKLQEKINNLSQAQMEYEQIKPDLGIINDALPQDPRFPSFVKIMERIASQSGTTIEGVNFNIINLSTVESSSSAGEKTIKFDFTLHGDYSNLTDFLNRLSNAERIVIIDKIGLVKKETQPLGLTLSGQIFYVQ